MKLFSLCMLFALAFADGSSVSFSSKRQTGKLDRLIVKTEDVVTQVSNAPTLPVKGVTFSSARTIGGNWQGDIADGAIVSFRSARQIGLMDKRDTYTDAMQAARDAHSGVSFTSARQTGLLMEIKEQDDDKDLYTRLSDAIDEEDWAVMTATLATFFATWFLALLLGICCGVYCCAKICMARAMAGAVTASTQMTAQPS